MTRDTRPLTSKHFPTEARLVRTLLNAEAGDLLPAFTLTQPSPRHKLTVTGPAWAFSYLAARLRDLAACAKGEWNGAAKCYEKLADKFAAAAPVTEEPVSMEPAAPATEEPAPAAPVTEEPAALATVELGTSPAGVQWNVYPLPHETHDVFEARVQVARERLATLHAKHAPAAPVTEEPARPARHRNALAHLAGLNDVVRDFLVDTYATETEMRWHERDPHTWTEREARECLDTQHIEDLGYMPPRTCDTWEDVHELVWEAYRLEALYA